jgi:hypothetical protein
MRHQTLLRYSVTAFVTDNIIYKLGAFRHHRAHKFLNAKHIRCVAHILNLVGCVFKAHPALAVLRDYLAHTRSFLKGKKNCRRQKRLQRALSLSIPSDQTQGGQGGMTV